MMSAYDLRIFFDLLDSQFGVLHTKESDILTADQGVVSQISSQKI